MSRDLGFIGKKGFLMLISLLLLGLALSASFASADEIYNEWHYSGDTFTVDGDVILLTHYDFYDNTVILSVNKNTYIVKKGECKETLTRRYCIEDIFQDLSNADEGDHIKFEGGKAYAGINIVISSRGPEIKVSRTFSITSPEINQEVSVLVSIENDGVEGTDSFIYKEDFPVGVVLTSFSVGRGMASNSITYDVNLPAKSSKSFTYTFKVTDYISFSSRGVFNYTYEGDKSSSSTSSVSVGVSKPYDFTVSMSPSSVEAGFDKSTFTVSVKNKVSEKINVLRLNITIPPLLPITSVSSELSKENNIYTWEGIVEPDETKTMSIQVKPYKSGSYTIPVSIRIKDFAGKEFSENRTATVSANVKQLETTLSVKESTVAEGGLFRVAFSIKNPNQNIGFRNIKTILKSEIFPELKADLAELMPGKIQVVIVNDTLAAPFVDNKKSYEIEASGSYDTTTSESYNFSKKASITVTPVADIISIIQKADRQEIPRGENLTITVEIRNNNEETIQASSYDEYPAGLILVGGKTSETLFFDNSGSKQAYTYKLQVPLGYDEDEIIIITYATVGGKNYAGNKTLIVKVKPAEKKNETSQEQQDEEAQQEQEQQQDQAAQPGQESEEEPGFFTKIINGISDFFKRLLKLK